MYHDIQIMIDTYRSKKPAAQHAAPSRLGLRLREVTHHASMLFRVK
jgi:hypothetical protein